MATRAEVRVVQAAGLVQGITLVTFPAASSILTSPDGYALSSTQYGALFLPQVLAAIAASLLGARLARATSLRTVLLLGLLANSLSMLLLLLSAPVQPNLAVAYPLLLLATGFLGVGFGLTVPTLNTYAAAFSPDSPDRAVLVLNALLGLGTALAPVFVALFVGLGFWWGLPALSTVLLAALLAAASRLPLRLTENRPEGGVERASVPRRFWLFASFALLYGICETMNGNWSQLYMTGTLGATTTQASAALAAFWAMVTVGRIGFAGAERVLPSRVTYHVLPFALALVLVTTAGLATGDGAQGVALFGLAGLACSALLPLTISFGQDQLSQMSGAAAGGTIAFYQIGYGVAAFGVGPLLSAGYSLGGLYRAAAGVALAMGLVSFALAQRPTAHASPAPT